MSAPQTPPVPRDATERGLLAVGASDCAPGLLFTGGSIRTTAACLAASICEIARFPQVTVPVMDVIDEAVINGTDREYRAAMCRKYGDNWEMME